MLTETEVIENRNKQVMYDEEELTTSSPSDTCFLQSVLNDHTIIYSKPLKTVDFYKLCLYHMYSSSSKRAEQSIPDMMIDFLTLHD